MSRFCTKCGSPINDGEICKCSMRTGSKIDTSSLSNFYISLKNRMGIGEPERNATDCYERGQRIVPDSIKTNESEIPVRQYNIAVLRSRLKFERAEGRIQVTNKRTVFRATGRSIMGRTTLQHEFAIDEIAGIEARRDYKFSFLNLFIGSFVLELFGLIGLGITTWIYSKVSALGVIIGLIFGILGMIPFFTTNKKFLLKLLPLSAGLGSILALYIGTEANKFIGFLLFLYNIVVLFGWLLYVFTPNLIITIKTKGATPAVDIRRKKFFAKPKEEYTGYWEVLPTNETERAIREIGAMISDIQKLGDFGVEKWKNN